MANICEISMEVRGDHSNIEAFFNALTQEDDVWMGRGADAEIDYDDEGHTATISGWCKWSVQSSLIDDALSMRKQKESKEGFWYQAEIDKVNEFLTLFEACQKYNVNMEVYSSEPGMEFQEHAKYENGHIVNEATNYVETFNEDTQEWESHGGYLWDFDVSDPDTNLQVNA